MVNEMNTKLIVDFIQQQEKVQSLLQYILVWSRISRNSWIAVKGLQAVASANAVRDVISDDLPASVIYQLRMRFPPKLWQEATSFFSMPR